MDFGVFIPIGNNGWLISENSPQYMPTWDLNRNVVQEAERQLGLNEDVLRFLTLRGHEIMRRTRELIERSGKFGIVIPGVAAANWTYAVGSVSGSIRIAMSGSPSKLVSSIATMAKVAEASAISSPTLARPVMPTRTRCMI